MSTQARRWSRWKSDDRPRQRPRGSTGTAVLGAREGRVVLWKRSCRTPPSVRSPEGEDPLMCHLLTYVTEREAECHSPLDRYPVGFLFPQSSAVTTGMTRNSHQPLGATLESGLHAAG
jgi:hypothetical protein